MPASDVAPLPRLGEVFFDVRGNSRTMRLSWYADTGVAVFSIWQGATCTATFRVPIADLPRLVEALQRGPQGASAAGSEVPGTGSRSIQGYAQSRRGHPTHDAAHDAGGYPAPAYESAATAAAADPLSAGTIGDEYAARGRHAVPSAAEGPAGNGYPDPTQVPTAAPVGGAYGGYGDVGGYGRGTDADAHAGYAQAAYDGYPDPDDVIRHAEPSATPGYPSPARYPDPGEAGARDAYGGHPSHAGYGERAQHGSPIGYHDGGPDPGYSATGYSAADPAAARGGYPRSDGGGHGRYAGSGGSAYDGYPQPARHPEPAGNALAPTARAGMSAPLEHTALFPADPGPPTVGMPPVNEEPGRSDAATGDSPRRYPPDPYLDGPLPRADRTSAEPRSPGGQRHAATDPRRAEDGPVSSRYAYPPDVVNH